MARLIAVVMVLMVGVARAQEVPHALLLVGARVLEPSGDGWRTGDAVLVVGDHISAVGPEAGLKVPDGVTRIDAGGLFLVPGLIDLHTHLLLHPYNEAKWDDQVLRESLELRTIRAVGGARATLEAGFTTIRELGTEGAGFADVALRDASAKGIMRGPRIFASTRAIVASACYGPSGFDPRWDVPQGAQEVTGPVEMRRAVREQIAAGADWVKVYADYRRAPGAPGTPTFSIEELKVAVDEATSARKPVAAHATTDEGIRRAILAGVTTVEHGYGASPETLRMMKEREIVLCPTMAAAEAVARYAGWEPGQSVPVGLRQSRESVRLAHDMGVTIACGSDAGVFAHGDNARELELMVEAGMTPAEAIRAATSVAARVLGKEDELGRIDRAYAADLVGVRGDPLADVASLRKVVIVVARGQVILDRR